MAVSLELRNFQKTKPRRVAVNVLWMCIITVPYHTGNLHIRRGLQVACYGLVKALRRPQRERDEPIRTPRFLLCPVPSGVAERGEEKRSQDA